MASTTLQKTIEQIDKMTDTLARQLMPVNFREALGWAAFLWMTCPAYRQAIIRGTSYFMTEIEVESAEGVEGKLEEIKNARQLLNRNFASTDQTMLALLEAMGFGGSCVYLFFPLIRSVQCICGARTDVYTAMTDHGFKYDLGSGDYTGKCPACGKAGKHALAEMRHRDEAHRAKLRRIPLSICRMKYEPISGARKLFVNCGQWDDVSRLVKSGDPLIHRETPREFIDSARLGCELELDESSFFYLGFQDASIIDMNLGGWSLPPFFYAFPDVIAILLLQHYNQVILGDYIPPLRYVAPPPTVGAARSLGSEGQPFDPTHAMTSSFTDFRGKIAALINSLKEDPSRIGVAPYPVQFGYLGLDGDKLLSVELLQHYTDSLMYNMGIPPEFYRGGIQAQVATPSHYGFALFERFWAGFVSNANRMYQWIADQLQKSEHWPDIYVNLVPPVRFADSSMLSVLHTRVQEGELSNDTFNRLIGVNTAYERRLAEGEQQEREKRFMSVDRQKRRKELVESMLGEASPDMNAYSQMQQNMQMQAQAAAGGGSMLPGGGQPGTSVPPVDPNAMAAPSGSPGATSSPAEQQVLDRVMSRARQAAQQLSTYPMPERVQMLRVMDSQQPEFRGMVEQALEDIENQARKQGLAQSRGQQ